MGKQSFYPEKNKKRRISRRTKGCLAILLSIGLLLPYPTDMVRAVVEGLAPVQECTHHLEHTADCGYVEAVEGHPCNHVHDEDCGYIVPDEEKTEPNNTVESVTSEDLDSSVVPNDSDNSEQDIDGSDSIDVSDISDASEAPTTNTCNHVHDENCGYVEAVPGHPCEFVCPICNPVAAAATPILDWKWIDEEEYLVFDDEAQMWYLALPGASEETPVTREILLEMLPAKVEAKISEEYRIPVVLSWDLSAIPEEGVWSGQLALNASVSQEYTLDESLPALTVVLDLGGAATYALTEAQLKPHIVTEGVVNPSGVTVNLFDYWVNPTGETPTTGDILTKHHSHKRETSQASFSSSEDWNRGINENHLLIFGDGIIHAGLWNKGAGSSNTYGQLYAGTEGIVKPVLFGGYPEINLADAKRKLTDDQTERDWTKIKDWLLAGDHIGAATSGWLYNYEGDNPQNLSNTLIGIWEAANGKTIDAADAKESLDYLFNPYINYDNKKSYENITGLFQLDDEGYYTYDMRKNFAEFVYAPVGRDMEASDGHFVLYDAPGTYQSDGSNINDSTHGNFFPFNKGTEVFTSIEGGKLVSNVPCSRNTTNHHFGMTVDVAMRQPADGKINMGNAGPQPMVFQFAGDDDVWIFIDDVLVLDLGGVHSEIYGTIDFSTGQVNIGRSFGADGSSGIPDNPADPSRVVTQTTLKDIFTAAGRESYVAWDGDTFANHTDHHLKMFYLERGNYDSSLTLRFNLQPVLYQSIKKVDKLGNPLANVEFELFEAQKNGNTYTAVGDALTTLTTDVDGVALFTSNVARKDGSGYAMYEPFDFSGRKDKPYYILKETKTPDGYRSLPIDIVLEFNPNTTMLKVVNRWTTGAYSSFTSTVTGNKTVTYGHYNADTNRIEPDVDKLVPATRKQNGLAVAIPMMKQEGLDYWQAVHGSNTYGFSLVRVNPDDYNLENWRKATLSAALYQCAEAGGTAPGWHLDWSNENYRLEGSLTDLPGRADRYVLSNPDGDMMMVYGIIEPDAFAALGITETNSSDRYNALGDYITDLTYGIQAANPALTLNEALDEAVRQTTERIMAVSVADTGSGKGFSFLDTSQFNRNFRSMIYIPNEQRELYVQKIDQNGRPINGAEFGLYQDEDCTQLVAHGRTATVNNLDGVLVFTPTIPVGQQDGTGYAKMVWVEETTDRAEPYFYLREISAPAGYEVNPTVTPVVVGIYSVYADAGRNDNGISVMAGVGKLVQTMVKFASDGDVNITLRDIKATGQIQNSGEFKIDGWNDMMLNASGVARTMNLHYGLNAVIDYGLHDEDGGKNITPYLITDTGFIRIRVEQNYDKLFDEPSHALKDRVTDDITSLFSLVNFVVVTDQTKEDTKTGKLAISKMLSGTGLQADDYVQNFEFELELTDGDGNGLTGKYNFFGTNKTGYVQNGEVIPMHHDESITILGLPEGTKFKVTEKDANTNGWHSSPTSGVISGVIKSNKIARADFANSKQVFPPAGNLLISKTVTGTGGDKTKAFTFTVTLTNGAGVPLTGSFKYDGDKEGTMQSGDTITLKDNEFIIIRSVPLNTKYTVTETGADGYTTTVNGVAAVEATGVIETDGETKAADFINHLDFLGNLTIKKTVTGSEGDRNKDFTFRISLTDGEDNALPGRFDYEGSKEGDVASGEEITLKHGQSITIKNLPADAKYAVTEVEANADGYTTTVSGTTGVIENSKTATAAFTNRKGNTGGGDPDPGTGNLVIKKTVTGTEGDRSKDFTFKVALTDGAGKTLTQEFNYDGAKTGKIASGDTVTLKHGEIITVRNLPADTKYTVTESEANKNGYTTTVSGSTGVIEDDRTETAVFTNRKGSSGGQDPEPGTGNLIIKKTVSGSEGDKTKDFTFTISLTDDKNAALTEQFDYTGSKTGKIASGDTVTLKHGQSITIENIPADSKYTVTETEANADGYTTTTSGAIGIIEDDRTETAAFTNRKGGSTGGEDPLPGTGNLVVKKTVTGNGGDKTKNFTFAISLTDDDDNALTAQFSYDGAKTGKIASGGTITLKHGESITIRDIPGNSKYTVTETEANADGYTTTSSGTIGAIVAGKATTAAFINNKGGNGGGGGGGDSDPEPKGNLIIRKTVTGSEGDKNRNFTFTITLTDAAGKAVNGNFKYDGVKTGTIASGKTLTLKDGDVITIHDIPADSKYVVTEQEANADGYTTTISGGTGTIKDNQNAIALFVNNKGDNEKPDDKNNGGGNNGGNENNGGGENNGGNNSGDNHQGNSGDTGDNDVKHTEKGDKDVTPKTGDDSLTAIWAFLVAVSFLGIFFLLRYRVKEK